MITNLHSPQWADGAHTSINLLGMLEGFGEVPFTARGDDVEAHGRDIFFRAVSGEFGGIAEFVPPTPPDQSNG